MSGKEAGKFPEKPSGGVREAYRQVRSTCCVHGSQREVIEQLEHISDYLGTKDPIVLGAALLLEQSGYQRSHLQLSLELT